MASFLSLTPKSNKKIAKKPKRPRPISKKAFVFGIGTSLYAIAGLMDLISYWSNIQDEEDDEFASDMTENATPMAALASFCYIVLAVLRIGATPSALPHSHHHHLRHSHHHHKPNKNPWWQTLLEEHLHVRAEYTLQVCFLMGSILLFAAEELKTHKLMRSLRKQQKTSQYCFIVALHLFWLSTYGLYKIVPTESDRVSQEKEAEDEEDNNNNNNGEKGGGESTITPNVNHPTTIGSSESSLEKCGRLFLLTGTTMELSMIYIEYFSEAKVSTGSILMGTFVSALCWWTNALLVILTERYYYPDWLDNHLGQDGDNKIVDFSFEDAMNLPDRLRQRLQQAHQHRRHVTNIRVV